MRRGTFHCGAYFHLRKLDSHVCGVPSCCPDRQLRSIVLPEAFLRTARPAALFVPLSPELFNQLARSWANATLARVAAGRAAARAAELRDPARKLRIGYPTRHRMPHGIVSRAVRDTMPHMYGSCRYISRRFEQYAGTQLMLGIFGTHDRARVSVASFAHGPADGSNERERITRDSDVFVDVSSLSPSAAAEAVRQQRVDVLIDYDGAHQFNNLLVLAHRPAAVQAMPL